MRNKTGNFNKKKAVSEDADVALRKTTLKEKTGYASASASDALSYTLVTTFFMFFLTTVAGVSPGIAGLLMAIAAVWNAIVNPIIGFFSDLITSKHGRRRPLLFASAAPLAIMLTVLFTDVPLGEVAKPIYFGIMLLLFWTIFDIFYVPYYALGAGYTSDYNDRTVIRLFSSFFNLTATMIAMALPTLFVAMLKDLGFSTANAWTMTAGVHGILVAVFILITAFSSKKFDPPVKIDKNEKKQRASLKTITGFFKEYLEIMRLKPMKPLIFISLFALIAYVMLLSDLIYLMTFNMHYSATRVSFFMIIRIIPSILIIPLIGRLIQTVDKKTSLIIIYAICGVAFLILRLTFVPTLAWILTYLFFSAICTAIYWQIVPSMYYDVCDYDRIHTGHRREAAILSFQGTVEALAEGIGTQILGLTLQFAGFNGSAHAQPPQALTWICNSGTILPVIFVILIIISTCFYPLNKKRFEKMMTEHPDA